MTETHIEAAIRCERIRKSQYSADARAAAARGMAQINKGERMTEDERCYLISEIIGRAASWHPAMLRSVAATAAIPMLRRKPVLYTEQNGDDE